MKRSYLFLLLISLSGCASTNEVASAYDSSNSVDVKPYTRTIYSSSNF